MHSSHPLGLVHVGPDGVPPESHPILRGITGARLEALRARMVWREIPAGEVFIRQGEVGKELVLICAGRVEVFATQDGNEHVLAQMGPGTTAGEMALIDHRPRSASVRAVVECLVVCVPILDLETGDDHERDAHSRLMANLAWELNRRLREANEARVAALNRELGLAHDRYQLGKVLAVVVVLATLYAYGVDALGQASGVDMLLASLGVAVAAAVGAWWVIYTANQPASAFGLSWKGTVSAVLAALRWSVAMCAVATLVKVGLMPVMPGWDTLPVVLNPMPDGVVPFLGLAVIYCLSSLVQELAVRSFLQSSFALLLTSRYAWLWAIILSNSLFSIFHLHYHASFAWLTLVTGFVYGAFWTRHRNLVAMTLLHFITGVWVMDVLGLFTLPGFSISGS
jgi:CRP-like cAMP-binding protein